MLTETFQLVQRNFEEAKNLARVRAQSAVAVSRLVGEFALKDAGNFVKSLEAILAQAKSVRLSLSLSLASCLWI